MHADDHEMKKLRDTSEELLVGLIAPNQPVLFLDVPLHRNIGDMLIMLGTLRALDRVGAGKVTALSYTDNYWDPRYQRSNTAIILQGGGNFGDLYPEHNTVRRYVLKNMRHNRVIWLPQTVFYNDPREANEMASLIKEHGDLHIYVRDERSMNYLISEMGIDKAHLAPDMAHALWPLTSNSTNNRGTLHLLRRDGETSQHLPLEGSVDWDDLFGNYHKKLYRIPPRWGFKVSTRLHMEHVAFRCWTELSQYWVHKAIQFFAPYSHVSTDRLHAHILACLMGKSSTLYDNSYGKNSAYFKTWTHRIESATMINLNAASPKI